MAMIMNPYAFGIAALTLTEVGIAGSSTNTCSLPAGTSAGDLAVFGEYFGASTSFSASFGSATGWTILDSLTGTLSTSNYFMRLGYRVVQVGDTEINTGSAAQIFDTLVGVYRPSRAITAMTPQSPFSKQITSGDPTLQSILISAQTPPVIAIAFAGANASGGWSLSWTTASPAFGLDLDYTGVSSHGHLGLKHYDSSPVDHSVDVGDNGAGNMLMSGYLLVT